MIDPNTELSPREQLRAWLDRYDHQLAERAVADVERTDDLRELIKSDDMVSSTQLRGLLNTAKMSPPDDLKGYVRKRKERRASADQDEAAFWDELESVLGGFDDLVEQAVEACGAEETTPQSVRDGRLDRRTVHSLLLRRYMTHFVAHCKYLQTLDQ
jgi:hypothetical protein